MNRQYIVYIILVLLLTTACSPRRTFHKLDKKYNKTQYEKVLDKANRYIRKNPADPVPLYFKAITYLHFYNENRNPADLQFALKYLYRARRKTIPDYLKNDINVLTSNALEITEANLSQIEKTADPVIAQKIYELKQQLQSMPEVKIAKTTISRDTETSDQEQGPVSLEGVRQNVVEEAQQLKGTKYRYGGTNHRGFDCSGFTSYVYEKAGITLPRTAADQASGGRRIPERKARPGDLVFFTKGKAGGRINHVAIILETGRRGIERVIHSTSRGVVVDQRDGSSWKSYWLPRKKKVVQYIND